MVVATCGTIDAGVMACGDGSNARRRTSRFPPNSAPGGELRSGDSRQLLSIDSAGLVFDHLFRARGASGGYCFLPHSGPRATLVLQCDAGSPKSANLFAAVPKSGFA